MPITHDPLPTAHFPFDSPDGIHIYHHLSSPSRTRTRHSLRHDTGMTVQLVAPQLLSSQLPAPRSSISCLGHDLHQLFNISDIIVVLDDIISDIIGDIIGDIISDIIVILSVIVSVILSVI